MRDAFNLPRLSHRYLIEEISEHLHLKVMLSSRFYGFHQSLMKCQKVGVRYLCSLSTNNCRTVHCKNLHSICEAVNSTVDSLTQGRIKKEMKFFEAPEDQYWKVAVIKDLMEAEWNNDELIELLEDENPRNIISHLTVSV